MQTIKGNLRAKTTSPGLLPFPTPKQTPPPTSKAQEEDEEDEEDEEEEEEMKPEIRNPTELETRTRRLNSTIIN